REEFEQKANDIETKFKGKPVPRPPHWGGYGLWPLRIEFWQEREFRLHDRVLYRRPATEKAWTIERLYP
ncbi:MAG: pyridoxamine 5'-phosphate oxidase, partial [Pseudomonadota bacterium]|nr:pyridoxamine 5'-phosphate oxidase [Pseudomonadota bacterium]